MDANAETLPPRLIEMLSYKPANFVPAGVDPATGVDSKDVTIDCHTGVNARLYVPPERADNKKLPILVYFHGGAFLLQDSQANSDIYHDLLNAIVSKSKVVAVSVNYRLASQARLPAAYNDALLALKWVFQKADPWVAQHGDFNHVFIAGDSAGANITHNLTMQMGGPEGEGMKIEGMVLLCPYFWGAKRIGGETEEEAKYAEMGWGWAMGPGMTLDDPRVNPLAEGAPSLSRLGCKRAFVCLGGKDWFFWRGKAYYEALVACASTRPPPYMHPQKAEYAGEEHVFFLRHLDTENAKDLLAKLDAFINALLYVEN